MQNIKKPVMAFLNDYELLNNILKHDKQASLLSSKYSLHELVNQTGASLNQIPGLNQKTINIISTLNEIIKRTNQPKLTNQVLFNNAKLIYQEYHALINQPQEHFYVIYLNHHKQFIKDKCLFIGTINMSVVHPREIFKEAYLIGASFIICMHNHPSGNLKPSQEDFNITKKINELGVLHGIILLDHIIIGQGYYSFFENHVL